MGYTVRVGLLWRDMNEFLTPWFPQSFLKRINKSFRILYNIACETKAKSYIHSQEGGNGTKKVGQEEKTKKEEGL